MILKMLRAKQTIREVAKKEGQPVRSVTDEIEYAIVQAYHEARESGDPGKIAMWDRIPKKGEIPTAVEMILFLTDEVKMKTGLAEI